MGTNNITWVGFGATNSSISSYAHCIFDDIAINDTTGTKNNSWCGAGYIIAVKPIADGSVNGFGTGYNAIKSAESGTGATTLKITSHGLASNDVIFNKTRNVYSIVTYVDADTLTTSSITNQAQNDEIILFAYDSTITAQTNTSSSKIVATSSSHGVKSFDVIVNTSRSNAIRRVIYQENTNIFVYLSRVSSMSSLGSEVSSQASGDTIKVYKPVIFSTTNKYEALTNNTDPIPTITNIASNSSGDKQTFDMQQLVSTLGISSDADINTVAISMLASGSGTIKGVLRQSSTNYVSDEYSDIDTSGSFKKIHVIMNVSPISDSQFTVTEIDSSEIGVEIT
jgi:hypothetical protein